MGVFAKIADQNQQGGTFARAAQNQPAPQASLPGAKGADFSQLSSNLAKIPGQASDLFLKTPARFLASAAAAPVDIAKQTYGLFTGTPQDTVGGQNIPFIGETFQNEANRQQKAILEGNAPLSSAAKPFLDVPLAGAETLGLKSIFKSGVTNSRQLLSNRAEKKGTEFAVQLTAPKVTPKVAEEAIASGRSTSPGIFKPAKITPSPRDIKVAESVADIVKPGPISANVDAISQKISQIDNGVTNLIANNKAPFNQNQLRSRLVSAAKDNNLVFASDATAKRTYDALVDEFMTHVKGKDTLGLFKARQSFDKVPAIKKLLDSAPAGENVRKQLVLTIREAANHFVADLLPANNPYRKMMKLESNMIEALGNIADSNASTIGKNKIQLLTEKYPVLKWLIGGTAAGLLGGGGVGVGSAIIGSSN